MPDAARRTPAAAHPDRQPHDLPGLPLTRECPYHPPRAYEDLRGRGPVTKIRLYDGREVWAVTGHAAFRSLLTDERLTVDRDKAEFPDLVRVLALARPGRHRAMRALLRTDPPLHTEQRRAMLPSLALKRVQSRRPALQAAADRLLDALAARPRTEPAELISAYVRPLVSTGTTEILGLRGPDGSELRALLHRHFDLVPPLDAFLRSLLARMPDRPGGDGLLDDLAAQVRNGRLTTEQFVHYGTVLVVAGQDVTISTIALAVLTLLVHREELDRLRAGEVPWSRAVEELLRFLSVTSGLVRVAIADIETSGVVIRAGDGVVLLNPAANRDPGVFEDADRLDLRRGHGNHVSFGFGVHQCIGQNLARLDLEIALSRLFERLPRLRLAAAVDEVPVRQGLVFGLGALPVRW